MSILDSRGGEDARWDNGHLIPDGDAECPELWGYVRPESQFIETFGRYCHGIDIGRFRRERDHRCRVLICELSFVCLIWQDLAKFGRHKILLCTTDVHKRYIGVAQGDVILLTKA